MLYVTIVMYNKKLSDVITRYSANKLLTRHGEKTRIIVIDNSDRDFINEDEDSLSEFVARHGILYIKSGENIGLSRAYNKALEVALHDSSDHRNDFLMFLDDDTDLTYDYMREVYKAYRSPKINEHNINIITGLIESNGLPMSPMKKFGFIYRKSNCIRRPGVYSDICCISSGMAVRLDALVKVGGFDESLFLDMVDYTLMYNLSRHDLNKMLVVNSRIEQNFSGRQTQDKRTALRRYKIYKKDFMRYSEITGKGRLYGMLHLIKRRISLDIKTK